MSKTDKTRPVWVQVADPHNRGWLEIWHNHERGAFRRPLDVCDADQVDVRSNDTRHGTTQRSNCSRWASATAAHRGVYPRASAVVAMYRRKGNGRSRTEWRRVSRDLLKSDRQAIYDSQYAAEQHRHRGLWDAY